MSTENNTIADITHIPMVVTTTGHGIYLVVTDLDLAERNLVVSDVPAILIDRDQAVELATQLLNAAIADKAGEITA